ncbi:hypothetical protein GF374_02460 [Candidatus Woesearchaeota archaeon]|nr:hypothetical protein [Candidatus Woesearchaeota archaeon]
MANARKKAYMKQYNKKPKVKAKKAKYMRKIRSKEDKKAARRLVRFLLDIGYEDLAYQHALERAPEMLITVKSRARSNKK